MRRLVASLASAAIALPIGIGVAQAAPPPEPAPGGLPPADSRELVHPDRPASVSAALAEATGPVTAFVELDAPSAVDTADAGGDAGDVAEAEADVEALAELVVPESAAPDAPQAVEVTSTLVAGVVVTGDAEQVRELAQDDAVLAVHLITPKEPANKGADAFTRALEAWTSTGATGAGVTIGVIDTGIDYTHADFGGPGTAEAYAAAYGTDGTGPVPAGTFDPVKFLGGYDFAGPVYDAGDPALLEPAPDANPIDSPDGDGGHGTHVAGSAAGYGVTADGTTFAGEYATLTDISDWQIGPGTAPEAGLVALKVFGDGGGSTGLVISALEWAADPDGDGDTADHLDVLNLSLGSDYSAADDPENLFIDKLSEIGVLSVIASGNASDVFDIGGSPGNSRSSLTVANSVADSQTFDAIEVVSGADDALLGLHAAQNSINYTGTDDVTAQVAFLGADVDGCSTLTDRAAELAGKIAYLWWDDNDATRLCGSTARFTNAAAAGAVGVLIGTEVPVFVAGISGSTAIPGAQMTAPVTDALMPAIESGALTLRIGPSLANAAFATDPSLADWLNSSSSRGVHGSLGIVKPDVAAPGTLISSASSGSGTASSTKSGTSMATPHVAGIAALVAQAQPDLTVAELKAAVMNTATHDVYSGLNQTGPVFGPERVGSGRVDAVDAVSTELLAFATDDPDLVSVTFGVVPVGTTTVVAERTVTVRNTGSTPRTLSTGFDQATTSGGATITVSPAQVTVPAGGEAIVTLTLTVDPATLAKDLDPTMVATYDLGGAVPRDYLTSISGRLTLTPYGGTEIRVPVQAAPKLVSDLSASPVAFADELATASTLSLTGYGVDSGGYTSLVAPFVLTGESPELEAAGSTTSASTIAAADLAYTGFSSTYPQIVAAGLDPTVVGQGTVSIAVATHGEWASLGATVVPVVDIDVDGDGVFDFETVVWKYGPELDLTTTETYSLVPGTFFFDELVDLTAVNGLWADIDSTVFDSDVVVVPISIDALGLEPGDTPTFAVSTYSPYATDPSGIVDAIDPFTVDPYAPDYWFDAGAASAGSYWYYGSTGPAFDVRRSPTTGDGRLLLVHSHNGTGERAEVVDVTAPVATPTTTSLRVTGPRTEGSTQRLTATVDPRAVSGTIRFMDGTTELGTARLHRGSATLTVSLPAGAHQLTAELVPGATRWAASVSAPVPVQITARQPARMTVSMPHTVTQHRPVVVTAWLKTDGATPSGTVQVREGERVVASARVLAWGRTGVALVVVGPLGVGQHTLTVAYSGNDQVAPASSEHTLTVTRRGRS